MNTRFIDRSPRVAVVIPAFRVSRHVLGVIRQIGEEVHRIYMVDAARPEQSGDVVQKRSARIHVSWLPGTVSMETLAQRSDLGKTYPLMALAFILVPVASHFVFGESFTWRYALGCALLVTGIVLTSGS